MCHSQAASRSVLTAAVAFAIACSSPPAGAPSEAATQAKSAALGDTVHIELGRSASFDNGRLLLTFLSRGTDSRCPANVVCVWMGDVPVRLGVRAGRGAVEVELHTGIDPRSFTLGDYVVTLVGMLPYPGTEAPNAPPATPTALVRVTK